MKNLIDIEDLNKRLNDEDLVIVDCRYDLTDSAQGRKDYEQDHIPGAFYFNLSKDLSGDVLAHGGRHPLPQIETFIEKIEAIGIDETKQVVAYDDQGGPFAARLWWLLNYLGHSRVAVLNANYSYWKESGYASTTDKPAPKQTSFTATIQPEMVMQLEEVKQITPDSHLLIDSRAPERYRGEVEPIDLKAGRIPGAVNYFWEDNLTEKGIMKSNKALAERFALLKDQAEIVVYCGSGVTGSVNVLALDNLGIKVKLYPGGWSDWSSYQANEVEADI